MHGYVTAGRTACKPAPHMTFANAAASPREAERALQQLPPHIVNRLMQVQAVVDSRTKQLRAMAMFTDGVGFTNCTVSCRAKGTVTSTMTVNTL